VKECKRRPNTHCRICKTPIYRRPGVLEQNNGNAYCSSLCYGKSNRKEKPCIVCGTPILASANKKTCSRSCANINRAGITYTGRRLKDNVVTLRRLKVRLFAARGKKCERCSFAISQVLQVHHQDRNTNNNTLNNLEILCPNCHAKEHYLKN
jgi:predicted nucleic acid-binding Zn ribbon protein